MVVLLSLLGIEGFRLVRTVQDLREGRDIFLEAADLLEERSLDVTAGELDQAEGDFERAKERIDRASGVLRSDPILSVAARLPWLGGQVDAARDLATIGSHSAAIGTESVEAFRTFQRIRDSEEGKLSEKIVPILNALDPHLTVIEDLLATVEEKRSQIRDGGLVPPLDSAVSLFDRRVGSLRDRLADYRLAQRVAPTVLGYEGAQTYLVLALDHTEIQGSGGFVAVYGFMVLDHGRLEQFNLDSVHNIGGQWPPPNDHDSVEPPEPLKAHLLVRGWPMSLAEAGWWPDFPTAAQNAIAIYRANSGDDRQIDGVVGVNFLGLEKLIEVTGPITVERYGVTVTGEDVIENTLIVTNPPGLQPRPWETDRYDFTSDLADELIDVMLAAEAPLWSPLGNLLSAAGPEKTLLIYHTEPSVQQAIVDQGFDGGILASEGDYLMLVDVNVGRNKLNLVVEPSIHLAVSLDEQGNATNVVRAGYTYDYSSWAQAADDRLVYLATIGGTIDLYRNYLRLLVPERGDLLEATLGGLDVEVEDVTVEFSRTVFGQFFSIPPDAAQELTFTYSVPFVVDMSDDPYEYRLLVQKQPGTRAIPLTVAVEVPPGMRIVSMELDGDELDVGLGQIATDLQQSRQIVVRYAPRG